MHGDEMCRIIFTEVKNTNPLFNADSVQILSFCLAVASHPPTPAVSTVQISL